jgi:hypothetical protein
VTSRRPSPSKRKRSPPAPARPSGPKRPAPCRGGARAAAGASLAFAAAAGASLAFAAACGGRPGGEGTGVAPARSAVASSPAPAAPGPATPEAAAAAAPSSATAGAPATTGLTDAAFGELVASLSEGTGAFPSENLVSNETSYLHVVPALEAPALRGGAYVGVGPEQNFTYLAAQQPELAFVADIRRENLLVHLFYKVAFERAATRLEFLSSIFCREVPAGVAAEAPAEALFEALRPSRPDPERVAARARDVEARARQLGVPLRPADVRAVRHVVEAFAARGPSLRYSMQGSARDYPPFGELLAARDDRGEASSFLGSEARYAAVRRLERENRVVPLTADFAGDRTFAALGDELRRRGLTLRVLYASNVEQYLLEPGPRAAARWAAWLRNVRALPRDERSVFLRSYFDQGRPHPAQRPGHRTTSLLAPMGPFLERATKAPFRSFFEVATFAGP